VVEEEETTVEQLRIIEEKLSLVQIQLAKVQINQPVVKDLLQNLLDSVEDKIKEYKDGSLPVICSFCGFEAAGKRGMEVHMKMMQHIETKLN
jgi:hypothetical protein